MLYRGETIEYELAYGRRYPAKGAEGERGHSLLCLETLRQKDYREEFLWREPRVGAPKGQVRRGVISQVKGQRFDLLKTDYASVFFYGSC